MIRTAIAAEVRPVKDSITNTTSRQISIVEKTKKDLKDATELLLSTLENDPAYKSADEVRIGALNARKTIRAKILGKAENFKLKQKVEDLRRDLKEEREVLASMLFGYVQETKQLTIFDEEGVERQIVPASKIK